MLAFGVRFQTINLGATAVNRARNGRVFMLIYTHGSVKNWTQSIIDWASPQNFPGETKIPSPAYRKQADAPGDKQPD